MADIERETVISARAVATQLVCARMILNILINLIISRHCFV